MKLTSGRTFWLPWLLFAFVVVGASYATFLSLTNPKTLASAPDFIIALLNELFAIAFGIVGALILARHSRNRIGWLLMAIGLALAVTDSLQGYLEPIVRIYPVPAFATYVLIWLTGWSWWLLIVPLLLLLLLFPTGHLLSWRWRWVVIALGMDLIIFTLVLLLSPSWQDSATGVSVPNPLGFRGDISFESIQIPFGLAIIGTVGACVLSVLIRYRRAGRVEQQQLKWFLFACAIFILIYPSGFFVEGVFRTGAETRGWAGVLFSVAILLLPVSIGIAILRHRLFDIDLIIRRTLIYSILTASLALVYFGIVILLQQLLRLVTTAGGDLVVIISTLAIAALFNPLRARVQDLIDSRFYRRKYDAEKVLARFAVTARDETDLDRLIAELVRVTDETLHPESTSIWLKRVGTGERRIAG